MDFMSSLAYHGDVRDSFFEGLSQVPFVLPCELGSPFDGALLCLPDEQLPRALRRDYIAPNVKERVVRSLPEELESLSYFHIFALNLTSSGPGRFPGYQFPLIHQNDDADEEQLIMARADGAFVLLDVVGTSWMALVRTMLYIEHFEGRYETEGGFHLWSSFPESLRPHLFRRERLEEVLERVRTSILHGTEFRLQ